MPRILLVDDKDHFELFTMILENEGYSVDAYADPDTALSKFGPNHYDRKGADFQTYNDLHRGQRCLYYN